MIGQMYKTEQMMSAEEYLNRNGIDYVKYEHPPVRTCEEAEKICSTIEGFSCKNLFLTDTKQTHFILAVVPADETADLKKIAETVHEKRVTFAKPEFLKTMMNLEPGSVSVFGLIHDRECKIELVIDIKAFEAEKIKFHPNRNDATLLLERKMFHAYIDIIKDRRKVTIMDKRRKNISQMTAEGQNRE